MFANSGRSSAILVRRANRASDFSRGEFVHGCPQSGGEARIEGDAAQPKSLWHSYYYAGYDTEYTCTDRDYFGPK
jgi:hypothetical protein